MTAIEDQVTVEMALNLLAEAEQKRFEAGKLLEPIAKRAYTVNPSVLETNAHWEWARLPKSESEVAESNENRRRFLTRYFEQKAR